MHPPLIPLSKFLALVLRHRPQQIGLSLDPQGWAQVNELLEKANRAGIPLTRELLAEIVESNDKKRYAFSPDGLKIRASQGHSLPVDLGLEPVAPPEILFHGTACHNLDSIKAQGLLRRQRTHVHLSPDEGTAIRVGQRHGAPVVLRIRAAQMARDGYVFYRSANGVWLTEQVLPAYIDFPEG